MGEQTRGQKTRSTIAKVAIDLFAERGVDATSIRDIAGAAGITEPAIYRHFENKASLIRELFVEHYRELAEVLHRVQAERADTRTRLRGMIETFCTLFDEEPALFRFLLMAQHRHEPGAPAVEPNPVDTVRAVLTAGMRVGELPHRDADLATAMVFGIVVQTATFKVYGRIPEPMTQCAAILSEAAWAALNVGADPENLDR